MSRSCADPAAHQPMRATIRGDIVLAAALGALGLAALGQGGWILVKAQVAQILLERAFTESVATGRPVKPWSWADTWPVARITVPRLGARAIALAGSSGQALAFGPGHLDGTPAAGEAGTAVYAAHRDTHFAFLGNVGIGDRIEVERHDGVVALFRVTGRAVVDWDATGIDAAAPGRHLVLATCWPLDARTAGPERLVVHAEAVGDAAAVGLAAHAPSSPGRSTDR